MTASRPGWEHVYAVVRRIPRGRVATYGQVAERAGLPGHARQVGYALHALPPNSVVPWHRVVNARGELSVASLDVGSGMEQRYRLEAEGVAFDARGRVALARFRWDGRMRRGRGTVPAAAHQTTTDDHDAPAP